MLGFNLTASKAGSAFFPTMTRSASASVRAVLVALLVGALLVTSTAPPSSAADPRQFRPAAAENVQVLDQLGGGTFAIDVESELAFVSDGTRLAVLDVTSPQVPELVGRTEPLARTIKAVDCDQGRCYVVDGAALYVVDVRVPEAPTVLGQLATLGGAGVRVVNDWLFVASIYDDLLIVAVDDPSRPRIAGRLDMALSTTDVEVAGDIAFLAARDQGVWVVDVSDPTQPRSLATFDTPGTALDVALAGSFLYVADAHGGLRVLDVSTPAAPREVASVAHEYWVLGVTVSGTVAYLSDGFEYRAINIANPAAPAELSRVFNNWGHLNNGMDYHLSPVVLGRFVLFPEQNGGMLVVDAQRPQQLRIAGGFATIGVTEQVVVANDLAYVVSDNRLHIVDPSADGGMQMLGSLQVEFYPLGGLAIENGLAAAAYGPSGISLVDVSDPTMPTKIRTFDTPGEATDVALRDGTAYVAEAVGGLTIVQVGDPRAPSIAANLALPGSATAIALKDDMAFVAAGAAGLHVVDVREPAAPRLLHTLPGSGNVFDVDIDADVAYLSDDMDGVVLVDVSEPASPRRMGVVSRSGRGWGRDGVAYVITGTRLSIYDIADPAQPRRVAYYSPDGQGFRHLAFHQGQVLLAGDQGGLTLLRHAPSTSQTCDMATALSSGASLYASLQSGSDNHVYQLTADTPFTEVEITVDDPYDDLHVMLFRSCVLGDTGRGAEAGAGRHAGTGFGRRIGGQRKLKFNVSWQSGAYYLRVMARSSISRPVPYRLSFDLKAPNPDEVITMILTSQSRLGLFYEQAALSAWGDSLDRLAGDSRVGGMVVRDVVTDTDDRVEDAYAAWAEQPTDPAKANGVAHALRDWIWAQRETYQRLHYVVIAGDDRIIPHLRVKIEPVGEPPPVWQTEQVYRQTETLSAFSTVGSALELDYTLSDDVYAASDPTPVTGNQVTISELHMPELAVGRLVETPAEMSAAMEAYLDAPLGLLVENSLTAGYDFMADAATRVDAYLDGAGLNASHRVRLLDDAWTLADLRSPLLARGTGFAFLAGRADHSSFQAPDRVLLTAEAVQAATADHRGAFMYALASHGGLNVPADGQESPGQPVDFPQAWLGRGAAYVGSTSWVYGMDHELAYQEELLSDFTAILLTGSGSAIGDALVHAKQAFLEDHLAQLDGMHAKGLVGTLLYGLPMSRVGVPRFQAARPPVDPLPPPVLIMDASADELAPRVAVKRALRYQFPTAEMVQEDAPGGGQLYRFGGQRVLALDGQPIQPRHTETLLEVQQGDQTLPPRAVVLVGGYYREVRGFEPVVLHAGVVAGHTASPAQALALEPERWYPATVAEIGRLQKTPGVSPLLLGQESARLVFNLGQYRTTDRIERLYDMIDVDTYFSAAEDQAPPTISLVRGWGRNRQRLMDVLVRAEDASEIARVVLAYADGRGTWRSAEAPWSDERAGYFAELPVSSEVLVQVVDGAGNVAVDDHRGRLYDADNIPPFWSTYAPWTVVGATSLHSR